MTLYRQKKEKSDLNAALIVWFCIYLAVAPAVATGMIIYDLYLDTRYSIILEDPEFLPSDGDEQ